MFSVYGVAGGSVRSRQYAILTGQSRRNMSCWHLRHGATRLLRRGLPMNDKLKKTVQEILQQDSCWETREDLLREGLLPVM